MTRKLSKWSKPGEKPPMVGVWMTDYSAAMESRTAFTYQYWDGYSWKYAMPTVFWAYSMRREPSFCNQTTVRFRGLADKPE